MEATTAKPATKSIEEFLKSYADLPERQAYKTTVEKVVPDQRVFEMARAFAKTYYPEMTDEAAIRRLHKHLGFSGGDLEKSLSEVITEVSRVIPKGQNVIKKPIGPQGFKDIAERRGVGDAVRSAEDLAELTAKGQPGYASGLGKPHPRNKVVYEPDLVEGLSMAERRRSARTFETGWRELRPRFMSELTSPTGKVRDLAKLGGAEKLGLGLIGAGKAAGAPGRKLESLAGSAASLLPRGLRLGPRGALGGLLGAAGVAVGKTPALLGAGAWGLSRGSEKALTAAGRWLLRNPETGFSRLLSSTAPESVKAAARPIVELLRAGKMVEAQGLALVMLQSGPIAEWIQGDGANELGVGGKGAK